MASHLLQHSLSDDDHSDGFDVLTENTGKTNKRLSVERIYQKKTQLEHVLLRPDTYIGSVEPLEQEMWVYDTEQECMVHRNITYVPGLYKIFDEVLVNAADNKQRDKKMDVIKIDIDPESNKISIYNNGKGIPVVEHKDEKMYVPSLIFGHLLTSSNYNDEEKKVTGGRNGYGAKLCNIFSTKFIVETSCKESRKCFKQTWMDNMSRTGDAKITTATGEDYTKITFYPDLAKFKMGVLDKDAVDLMARRAYDVAGSTKGIKVFLNGKKLPIKGFKDYVELYLKNKTDEVGNPLKIAYEDVSERWEIAVALSTEKGFTQVSFVNSIATTKGGRHVDHVADQIAAKLMETVKKKNKDGVNIKKHQLLNNMFLFVNCLIENPTFDSQTKENMTLQVKGFGSKCAPSDKFFASVLKIGIVDAILQWVKFKAQKELDTKCSSKKKSRLHVAKLEDANDAGKKNSVDCTLIITEGDSAKALAVSGLGVVGRDKYGVFPLRGKMLNVREATHKQILENAEINNLIRIIGLQYKKKYQSVDDLRTLRYGKLMIMADQDQDGSHIKGLVINFIHHNWPDLLKLPFLEEFITPIVKVTRKKETKSFFSLPEFDEWKRATSNWHQWNIKYYKGLGTSTSDEAKEYFSDLHRHRITFKYHGAEDDHSVVLAFSKKMVEQRKDWLTNNMEDRKRRRELGLPEVYLYGKNTTSVSYKDFVNKELILFSNLDNERSIPSMMDGLKPGQRKVMFTCFKRNDKREVKVAQLSGAVGEASAYHHGEQSLTGTIVNLAQNFVGSNNINLLQPIGQFGTRLQGGKDAASARYIFTKLSPLTRKIFVPADDPILNYLYDDNLRVEPEFYVPIIPMILVNGAEGIGTGWSTKIPNYNPREIVANVKRMIEGQEPEPMKPWYKGFRGSIVQVDNQKFVCSGEVAVLDDDQIEITELPIKTWTQNYKENVLEAMLQGSDKQPSLVTDFREYHTDTTVKFVVVTTPANLDKFEREGMHKALKLQTTFTTTSMVSFDHNGCIRRYDQPEEVLKEFYEVRLEYYRKRKAYMEGMLEAEAQKLVNQARFILEKNQGDIKMENVKKAELIRILIARNYDSDPVKAWRLKNNIDTSEKKTTDEEEGTAEEEERAAGEPDYDYLLDMKMRSMLREKVDELLKQRETKKGELDTLRKTPIQELWIRDLNEFLEELEKVEALEASKQGTVLKTTNKPLKGVKARKVTTNALPSDNARRIEPAIDVEAYKKKEGDGGKKGGRSKKAKDSPNGDDVCEDEDKPLAQRLGNSPAMIDEKKKSKTGKLKQTTLNFKPLPKSKGDGDKVSSRKAETPKKKGGKRKNPWSQSESDSGADEVQLSDSDDDFEPIKPRETTRRAAASNVKFNFQDDDDEATEINIDKDDLVSFSEPVKQKEKRANYDSDDLMEYKSEEAEAKRTSEELFDTFIKQKPSAPASSETSEPSESREPAKADREKPKAKSKSEAAPKKRTAAPKKKVKTFSGSDSDTPVPKKKAKKPAERKKNFSSSEDDEIAPLAERIEARERPGRKKPAVKYTFDDSTDDD